MVRVREQIADRRGDAQDQPGVVSRAEARCLRQWPKVEQDQPRARDHLVHGRLVREWMHLRNPSRCAARDRAWNSHAHARCRGWCRLSAVLRVSYADPPVGETYTTDGVTARRRAVERARVGK